MKLCVDGIAFSYNSHPVLAEVSFTLRQGEILGVLGINGAGKSTLLQCLNRLLAPRRGRVLVDEEDLATLSRRAVARRMGYVPQRHPQSNLTVFEAVLLGRRPHLQWRMGTGDYDQVEALLTRLGLAPLAMRPVRQLSGGELQKVVIARALAQEPAVLLMDEPTSNLDLKNQLEVMALVAEVAAERGLAVVVAIHDLNLALRFAHHLLFLKEGRVHALNGSGDLSAATIETVYGVPVSLSRVGGHTVVVPQ
ncbi:MAG: ABC transporter ATP-binding protein [Desulfosarcinaceae bacterium]